MSPPVLWQFRFSHFNEKARWALDWKGIPHLRRSLVPALHVPRTMWLTGQKSVPVLVLDGRSIADSTRIIATLEERHPEAPLYPDAAGARDRALALEDFCDEALGPFVRRALFHTLLPDADFCVAMFTSGTGTATRAAYRAGFPLIRSVMRLDMKIDAAGAEAAGSRIRTALDRLAGEIGPAGYLVGDRFTVADLTAAAMLSPLFAPPEYPYPLPGPYPAPARAFCAGFADHPAVRWAADIYRRHRSPSSELRAVA